MIPRADHLREGFPFETKLFCETCKVITDHNIRVLKDSPEDGGVPTIVCCLDCLDKYLKLDGLGIESDNPTKFKRFLIDQWSWLVYHSKYLD